MAGGCLATCVAADFGNLSDGRKTRIWRLQCGAYAVDVSDYGGRIVRVYAPDRFGNLADVTLGWNTAAEYEKYGFSMGTLIGRYGKGKVFTARGISCSRSGTCPWPT